MKKYQFGFSLVEILVVVSIIGVLTAVLTVNFSQSSIASRDTQRLADLRTLQTAIDLYKNKYGRYPEGCNGSGQWSGHAPVYDCPSGDEYIVGLAPEFIPKLPKDPKLNGNNSGYAYTTNADGTVYKFIVYRTVEAEVVNYTHKFKMCDYVNGATNATSMCLNVASQSNNFPAHCRENNAVFQTSYAIWGGYAVPTVAPSNNNYDLFVEHLTEDIVCSAP